MKSPSLPESRFQRILFCTDFSESADAAFEVAVDTVARRPGAVLHLLHVIHEPDAQFWTSYLAGAETMESDGIKAMETKMAEAYLSRIPTGVCVKVEFRPGPDAAAILEFARTAEIDLIILGRHGHSSVGKALFGSVAEKIVRKAPCPVLVVPLTGTSSRHEKPVIP